MLLDWLAVLTRDRGMAGVTVELRQAAIEDAAAMTTIFLEARRVAMPYLPSLYTDAEVFRWIETVVLPGCHVLLAILDGRRTVGFTAIRADYLDHLYVSPTVEGQGIGGQLLAAAKEASPQGLWLHVFQRNARARIFYKRRGFCIIALRDGSQNEEREPDAVYEWRP
jgi:ribosomal protein S18 acetylase RimI-like enzyme